MGRFVKNLGLHSGSYAIRMPLGSASLGPQQPRDGQVRFNVSANTLEVFYSSAWHGISQAGRVEITKDVFIGDGVTQSFTMVNQPLPPEAYSAGQEAEALVFIGNVFQEPGLAYSLSGADIFFTSAPDLGVRIVILHNFNSTHVR